MGVFTQHQNQEVFHFDIKTFVMNHQMWIYTRKATALPSSLSYFNFLLLPIPFPQHLRGERIKVAVGTSSWKYFSLKLNICPWNSVVLLNILLNILGLSFSKVRLYHDNVIKRCCSKERGQQKISGKSSTAGVHQNLF